MDAAQRAFRDILQYLARAETSRARNEREPYLALRDRVAQDYRPLRTDELEGILSARQQRVDFSQVGGFLFAEQRRDSRPWQPILRVLYEPRGAGPDRVCIRIGMLAFEAPGQGASKLVGFGFRLECPDDPHEDGRTATHDFWHAQPIRSMGGAGSSRPGDLPTPAWMPDVYPTLALDADDPLSLLLHSVLFMHGRDGMDRVAQRFNRLVKPSMDRMFRGNER